jgi:ankyrin repeat protein
LASLAGGMNIDSQDSVTGMTFLMRAVTFGQENIVKLLLNHGANINIKDNTGSSPLIAACEQVKIWCSRQTR